MTFAQFIQAFPALKSHPPAAIERALADAARYCPADVWGDEMADGIGYRAAHTLSIGPGGAVVQTNPKAPPPKGWESTVYGQHYAALMRTVTLRAPRVASDGC